jgi:hypothetical protein
LAQNHRCSQQRGKAGQQDAAPIAEWAKMHASNPPQIKSLIAEKKPLQNPSHLLTNPEWLPGREPDKTFRNEQGQTAKK